MKQETIGALIIGILITALMVFYWVKTDAMMNTDMLYRNDLQRLDAYPRIPDVGPLGEMYTWNYDNTRLNEKYCGEVGTAAFRESDGKFDHCFY